MLLSIPTALIHEDAYLLHGYMYQKYYQIGSSSFDALAPIGDQDPQSMHSRAIFTRKSFLSRRMV